MPEITRGIARGGGKAGAARGHHAHTIEHARAQTTERIIGDDEIRG